ncbi:MAG TPA: response regulator transcription factor [Burkholderiales bacterium]|nr:response regulator transcription factor [Burkholderiales bacterium]
MKVLVVDDHVLIREALKQLLQEICPKLAVLEAADCANAIRIINQNSDLELILLDLQLPDKSGFAALSECRSLLPSVPVVVLSASEDRQDVMRALDGGAMGFIPKSHDGKIMLNALRMVLGGGVYLPADIVNQTTDNSRTNAITAQHQGNGPVSPAEIGLTGRQADVLALLIQGKPNKLICRELGLAEGTVKIHVTAILRALGVTNRTQAVIAVGRLGIKFDLHRKHV